MKYLLKHKNSEVGVVTLKNSDFPNLWGILEMSPSAKGSPIEKYIEFCVREKCLLENGPGSHQSEKMEALILELESFKHFVESDDWSMTDEAGEVDQIMSPIFGEDYSITWRWEF